MQPSPISVILSLQIWMLFYWYAEFNDDRQSVIHWWIVFQGSSPFKPFKQDVHVGLRKWIKPTFHDTLQMTKWLKGQAGFKVFRCQMKLAHEKLQTFVFKWNLKTLQTLCTVPKKFYIWAHARNFIGATKSVSQPTAVTKKFSFEKRLPTPGWCGANLGP